jgi:hypothetical protein
VDLEDRNDDRQDNDDNDKIGNLRKQPFNKMGLIDYHSSDKKAAMKKIIKKQRSVALFRQKREMELIELAVNFFKCKMGKRRIFLQQCVKNSTDGSYKRPLLAFEEKCKCIMSSKKQ